MTLLMTVYFCRLAEPTVMRSSVLDNDSVTFTVRDISQGIELQLATKLSYSGK